MTRTSKQRGISLFKAADAPFINETDIHDMSEEQWPPLLLEAEASGLGNQTRVLVRDVGGFSLVHVWFKPNYMLPRHCHRHDCMYFLISGSAIMGNRTLRVGDSFFVPSGAPYQYVAGPDGIEVLEVRHNADHVDMDVFETPEQIEKRVADMLAANRDLWASLTVPPLLVANAAT